jgi:hypothetical protein
MLTLDASKLPTGIYSIEILNSLGQTITFIETEANVSNIDVSRWAKGVYIITIKDAFHSKTKRLIIQ